MNTPSDMPLDNFHKMVVENGGTFSMNLNNSVTHCVAAESKGLFLFHISPSLSLSLVIDFIGLLTKRSETVTGIKFQAAKRNKDVLHYSWFLECCSQKKLLPLLPKLVCSNSFFFGTLVRKVYSR